MIHFIQTGGTIDKDYTPTEHSHGYNFDIADPAFAAVLKKLFPKLRYTSCTLLKKDSLDITESDRQEITAYIASTPHSSIVITHGTDTIEQTARSLNAGNKVVVLTGAMKPHRFTDSDAEFNIGMAIGVALTAKPGVYIALNGSVKRL